MSPPIIGAIGVLSLLVLIGLRVPVAIAMGVVGIVGGSPLLVTGSIEEVAESILAG